MKKFLLLTKVLLKTGFGNGIYSEDGKGGNLKKTILYIFLGICMIPVIGMMGYLGYAGYNLMDGFNTGILLGITCYIGVFFAFFTGMTMCVGIFYNSSDTEFLLPMPFKAEQIVGAKFMTMYVYTLVTDLLIVFPVFVGYGIAGNEGVSFWLIATLVTLIIPITPLVYGSVVSMIIIRVFKRARNKDFITVISSIFAVVMVVAINAFTNSTADVSDTEMISVILDKGTSIMDTMGNIFPNTTLAEKAISNENPVMLLLFLLSALAFVILFILVAKAIYIKTVVVMSSAVSKKKVMTQSELKKAVKKNSKVKAYVLKELKLVFRTPIYFMNCVMLSLIWPVIVLIPALMQIVNGGEETVETAEPSMGIGLFDSDIIGGICMLVVFGVTILAISFSMMSTTCISREGKNVIFMKYIPMSYEKQLISKIIPGILVTLVTGTVYSAIGMLVVGIIYEISIPPLAAVLAIIISILTCVLFNFVDIISDILKPKLEWQTEQAAVKQNFVAIIPMFLTMILGVLMGVGAFMLYALIESVYMIALIAIAILAILSFVFYKIDIMLARKCFAKY